MTRPKLCFITAVPMTVTAFLNKHIEHLASEYEIFVISDFSAGRNGVSDQAQAIHAPVARRISFGRDVLALWALVRIFRQYRFDVIHSVTPKAGLLGMLAGFISRVPKRIHWFTGQVWVTRVGIARYVLKAADRLLAGLATHLLADSPSQRAFLEAEGIGSSDEIQVIGEGSICGVDGERFRPNSDARQQIREKFHIPDDAPVVLFLGRLNVDKGLREMKLAVEALASDLPNLHWLFVGPDEEGMEVFLRDSITDQHERLHFQGFTREPEAYMAAADLFCLPSYREGFGSSILEAAAVGLASVATKIYGLTDAVEDGVTGLLVEPRNGTELAHAIKRLVNDVDLRSAMGSEARARALQKFSCDRVTRELGNYYRNIRKSDKSDDFPPD